MSRRSLDWFASSILAIALIAGCSSVSDEASTRALDELTPSTIDSSGSAASDSGSCDPPTAARLTELSPSADSILPPGQMTAGSSMAAIQQNGRLRVGVDENTRHFSARESDGQYAGFEADLARQIALAIFDDDVPTSIEWVPVVTANKVTAVANDEVDLTISVVSKSCERWEDVDFSSTYYSTSQAILMPAASPITGIQDLGGQRVCVTSGSSSEKHLKKHAPEATVVPVEARTDCMVALQEGRVDAIFLPHSILFGLWNDDDRYRIIEGQSQPLNYGIAIATDRKDLTRFVNGLLEQWRTDGTLAGLDHELPLALQKHVPLDTPPDDLDPGYREP